MIIDFKEIPAANTGSGLQDTFELFVRDFLEEIGFHIIQHPDRGPDGKKDMIVRELRSGVAGVTQIDWLVSCKHNAHSGKSVSDKDELNIYERLTANKCKGFIGVYSTLQSSSFNDILVKCKEKFESRIYDHEQIEKLIIGDRKREVLIMRYFPNSYEKLRKLQSDNKDERNKIAATSETINFENLYEATITANCVIEIEKIKNDYYDIEWNQKALNKLFIFSEYKNAIITDKIISFVYDFTKATRFGIPTNIISIAHSLITIYFPVDGTNNENKSNDSTAIMCTEIAYNILYDTFIYLKNYRIAAYGLGILKCIYRYAKKYKRTSIEEMIIQRHNEISSDVLKYSKDDMTNAQRLIKIFADDLETNTLSFPPLPFDLTKLVNADREY